MVAPSREQCGVTDYSRFLVEELRQIVDVRYVTDSAHFTDEMNDVDVVHVQHQYFLFGGVAPWKNRFQEFSTRLRAPTVVTAHEFVEPYGNAAMRTAIGLSNRRNFRHRAIRKIIVHTQADRDRMAANGIPQESLRVIRLGVPRVDSLFDRDAARESLGVSGRFVITLFGFLSRRKGHSLAIDAMRKLPENAYLLLAGGRHPDDTTDYVDGLRQHIRDYFLEDRVRITDYLSAEDVAKVMSATDLVIAPFTESSGSASLAHAFAYGKPILASAIPPHAEMLQESSHPLATFATLDPASLANEVSSLMEDSVALALLSAGSGRYAAEHTYKRMAEQTVEVYREVIGGAV
jgi:glycosyltransferase involved in cell wall biosynthesis